MTQQHPHEIIWTLTNAVVASRALHVVADLGVADNIHDEPVAAKALAAACDVDPDALDRVLRLLTAHGIFESVGGCYGHTEPSRLLQSDNPMSMRAFSRMIGSPPFLASFDQLEHSVRTGSPAMELVDPDGLWSYLRSHPAQAEIFDEAMTAKAGADIAAVLDAYDFNRFGTIADIGGGRGHLLRAVLDAVPTAKGILFDLPSVIETVRVASDRLATHAGDFFVNPLPVADLYILMEVIHDWADAEAGAVLGAVRGAAAPGSIVVVIEAVLPDEAADQRVQTLDIIMLAITGGRERTATQLDGLLSGAGFRVTNVIETMGPLRVVEAVAV